MAIGEYGGPGGGYGGGTGPGVGTGGGAGLGQGGQRGGEGGDGAQDRQDRARRSRARERGIFGGTRSGESKRAAQAAVLSQFGYTGRTVHDQPPTQRALSPDEVIGMIDEDRVARATRGMGREEPQRDVMRDVPAIAAAFAMNPALGIARAMETFGVFDPVKRKAEAVVGDLFSKVEGMLPGQPEEGGALISAVHQGPNVFTPGREAPMPAPVGVPAAARPGPAMGPGGEGRQRPAPAAAEAAPAQARPASPGLETGRVIGEASKPVEQGPTVADDGALAWLQQMRDDIRRSEQRIVRI